jgi:hypothetical protein
MLSLKKNYKKKNPGKKQHGGNNVVSASIDLINSMIDLGKSIFTEIDAISNVGNQLNNGAFPNALPKSQSPPQQVHPKL